jgi:hypothetical protein
MTDDATIANKAWSTTGNTGLSGSLNFLGTTDAIDLPFQTNGAEKMRLFSLVNPSLGIGVTSLAGISG